MPPTRTTPTSCPDCQVSTIYHNVTNCQDGKKGQDSSEYLARLYLLYTSDPTDDRRDELLIACLARLKKTVRYHVYRPGICPYFMARVAFAYCSWSLAIERLWRGL